MGHHNVTPESVIVSPFYKRSTLLNNRHSFGISNFVLLAYIIVIDIRLNCPKLIKLVSENIIYVCTLASFL